MHIVWFKKDLRLYDHEALLKASNCGPVLLIYILEPDLWQQSDMSYRHYRFLNDCLGELDQECNGIGKNLCWKSELRCRPAVSSGSSDIATPRES